MSMFSFLDREHTIAKPGYSRWLVPPAALCVQLCIGQIYAFSVLNLPMSRLLGITRAAPGDWELTSLGWIFSLAMAFLGLSAALAGTWPDRAGPRKAMALAALCFSGGFFISAIGVYAHTLWLLYLGYGVIGGCGLGIGYISPAQTLITWFPERPGMATGVALMGFGGGAVIASPLSVWLMRQFTTPTHIGVAETFIALGVIYLIFMLVGAAIVRVPAPGWAPENHGTPITPKKRVTTGNINADRALSTPQFYLLWWVLCLNATAGIGVISQASAMSQEMFPGRITPLAAAGFIGLLSLSNMGGRLFWATASDYIGRKQTYVVFFLLGILLYAAVPTTAHAGSVILFVLFYCVIIGMYGGGFSTIPAYLTDIFGVQYVGAIHGRLLTAWSAAGIFGPVLVNYLRQYQIDHGVSKADAYTITMYIMAGLLLIGLICNSRVRAVRERHAMKPQTSQA